MKADASHPILYLLAL